MRDAKINNKENVKALINTGSSCCLIRDAIANNCNLSIEPVLKDLYGFGSQILPSATAIGHAKVDIEIEKVIGKNIDAFIVHNEALPTGF